MDPQFTFHIEAKIPSLLKSTTEYTVSLDQADSVFIANQSLHKQDQNFDPTTITRIYRLRHDTAHLAGVIDTKNIPSKIEYETTINGLVVWKHEDNEIFT